MLAYSSCSADRCRYERIIFHFALWICAALHWLSFSSCVAFFALNIWKSRNIFITPSKPFHDVSHCFVVDVIQFEVEKCCAQNQAYTIVHILHTLLHHIWHEIHFTFDERCGLGIFGVWCFSFLFVTSSSFSLPSCYCVYFFSCVCKGERNNKYCTIISQPISVGFDIWTRRRCRCRRRPIFACLSRAHFFFYSVVANSSGIECGLKWSSIVKVIELCHSLHSIYQFSCACLCL